MKEIYKVKNLTKTYDNGKVIANDNLTFNIKKSEIFGLLGPNGSGKTTLIKQLIGLSKPDSGEIYFNSIDVLQNPESIDKNIGYMSQRVGALSDLTVEEALYVTSNLYGFSRDTSRAKTENMISFFRMNKFKNRIMGTLSGGQSRLVSFALSIIHSPEVVFLDEPTNDIDPEVRKIIWDKIFDLKENFNTAIIVATHNLSEAESILDRVAIMENGRILEIGSMEFLKENILKNKYIIALEYEDDILRDIDLTKTNLNDNLLNMEDNKLLLSGKSYNEILELLNSSILKEIGVIKDFSVKPGSLEEVYLNIIKYKGGD